MSIINDKPEIFGIEVTDFYILMIIEFLLLLLCFIGIAPHNFIAAMIVFVVLGGTVYVFINLKKLLPEHFFFNLYKYLTGPKIYITSADLNPNNPIFKKIIEEDEENNVK